MFSPEQTQKELDDLEERVRDAVTYVRPTLTKLLNLFIDTGEPELREREEGSLEQLCSKSFHLAKRMEISALLEEWRKEHYQAYDSRSGLYADMYDDFEVRKTISRLRGEIALMKQTCDAINKIESPYARGFIESHWSQIVQTNQEYIAGHFEHVAHSEGPFIVEEVISDIAAQLRYAEDKEERAIVEGNLLYVPVFLFKKDYWRKNKRTRSIFELPNDDYDLFSRVFDYVYSKGTPSLEHILPRMKDADASYVQIAKRFEKTIQENAKKMIYNALAKPAEERQLN